MTRVARRAALISVTGLLIATAAASTSAAAQNAKHVPRPHVTMVSPRPHVTMVSGHDAAVTAGQQTGVRRYWTRARMEHAIPLHPGGRQFVGSAAEQAPRERTWQSAMVSAVAVTPGAAATQPVTGPAVRPTDGPAAGPTDGPRLDPVHPGHRHPGHRSRHGHPRRRPQRSLAGDATTSGARWTGGGAVARTTGKVFFSLGGHDYVCSGSTVDSANSDVVVTAAHCVVNPDGAWATNWTFVPGYSGGNPGYGSYSARSFYVASQWSSQGDNDYDVAFVVVNPATVGGAQVQVTREVGGQAIEFGGQPAQEETAFGYPADAPYNGQQLYYCSGAVRPDPYHETGDSGLPCVMTAGSSGGPWLAGFSPASGTGTITSVSSFKYSTDTQVLYGTPLGSAAQSLYTAAQHA